MIHILLRLLNFWWIILILYMFIMCTLAREKCVSRGHIPGICTSIEKCPSALSTLAVGSFPRICKTNVQNRNPLVCCATVKRISELKCDMYTSILKQEAFKASPLLPFTFNQNVQNGKSSSNGEINCKSYPNKLIVGGRNALREEFPFMVSLSYSPYGESEWLCGGVLISDEFVLTAAHCVVGAQKPRRVLVGDINLSGKSSSRRVIGVRDIIIHPNYKPPLIYNDIALVRLVSKLNLSRYVLPACLPQPRFRLDKKKKFIATGWGLTTFDGSQSKILQGVNLTKFGLKECNDYFRESSDTIIRLPRGIVRSQICAGDKIEAKDSCRGDSGGGLTVRREYPCVHYVAGLVSFGSKYCGNNQPGVYTNVQTYIDWIEDKVWT